MSEVFRFGTKASISRKRSTLREVVNRIANHNCSSSLDASCMYSTCEPANELFSKNLSTDVREAIKPLAKYKLSYFLHVQLPRILFTDVPFLRTHLSFRNTYPGMQVRGRHMRDIGSRVSPDGQGLMNTSDFALREPRNWNKSPIPSLNWSPSLSGQSIDCTLLYKDHKRHSCTLIPHNHQLCNISNHICDIMLLFPHLNMKLDIPVWVDCKAEFSRRKNSN